MGLSAERSRTYDALESKLRNTPLREAEGFLPRSNKLLLKMESELPTGSPFDRMYPAMFRNAEERGHIAPGVTPLVECSIGSAGASFSYVARELGYTDTLVLGLQDIPRSRVALMEALGSRIELLKGDGPSHYVERMMQLLDLDKEKHGRFGEDLTRLYAVSKIQAPQTTGLRTAGHELVASLQQQGLSLDHLVVVVGSGSTLTEIGTAVIQASPDTQFHAVETQEVPQLTAFRDGQGPIKAPENWVRCGPIGTSTWGLKLDRLNIPWSIFKNNIITLPYAEGDRVQRELNECHDLRIGRVTGVAAAAARDLVEERKLEGATIAVIATDTDWKWSDELPQHVLESLAD